MKLIIYKGSCQSLAKFGIKFTKSKPTAIVDDEDSKKFEIFDDFSITDIQKSDIVPNNKNEELESEEQNEDVEEKEDPKRTKLMKLKSDQLQIMCEENGLKKGTKEQMVDQLLQVKE